MVSKWASLPVTSLVECNTMGQISASYKERRKTIALIEPIVAELSVDPGYAISTLPRFFILNSFSASPRPFRGLAMLRCLTDWPCNTRKLARLGGKKRVLYL